MTTPQKTILVVEDSDDVRLSYVRWLDKQGYAVLQARDAGEALRIAAGTKPDLVLLDINLPDMDGYALAKKWHGDPRMAAVPVIVLSGRSGEEHERTARGSGAILTLKKPCPPDLILATIQGALQHA